MAPFASTVSMNSARMRAAMHAGLDWWLREIGGTIPSFVSDKLKWGVARHLVRIDGSELRLCQAGVQDVGVVLDSSRPLPRTMAESLRAGGAVTLQLPAAWLIRRVVTLPLAAASDLNAAASFLIGRLSPFRTDEVLYAARLLTRDRKAKMLRVEVAIAPRDRFQPAIDALADLNIIVSNVQVPGDMLQPMWTFRAGARGGFHTPSTAERCWRLLLVAAFTAMILGPYAVAWRVHDRADALVQDVAAARTKTGEAAALRAEIDKLSSEVAFLAGRRKGPHVAAVVDALSTTLPDTTWLFRLDVHAGEAALAGLSSDIPAMLKSLDHPPFAATELAAPVMSGSAGDKSRFELRLILTDRVP